MHKPSKTYDAETLAQILSDLDVAAPSALPEYGDQRREFPSVKVVAAGKRFRVVGNAALVAIVDRAAVASREYDQRHARAQAMEAEADEFYDAFLKEAKAELSRQYAKPVRSLEAVS